MSFGIRRRLALGLDVNPPGLAEAVEVVDVEAAELDLEGLEDRGDRDVEDAGLAPVELEAKLGNAHRERREQAGQLGPFPRLGHEAVGDVRQRLHAAALAILDQELEPAGGPQALDRRGREDERQGLGDLRARAPSGAAPPGPGPAARAPCAPPSA